MNAPVFSDKHFARVRGRIEQCTKVIASIKRKRSWPASVKAMSIADYSIEREEWQSMLVLMEAQNKLAASMVEPA